MVLRHAARLFTLAVLATPALAQPPDVQGRFIAAISDADMRAYAYIDGQLGAPRGADALSIVTLPLAGTVPTATLEVSNSVINPVFSIATSPDGTTLFVAETREPREPGDRTIQDLDAGRVLRAIDVSEPSSPRLAHEVSVGLEPKGVDVSADGRTLVLATSEPDTPLVFVTYGAGGFGEPRAFPMLGFTPVDELANQGMLPHHAEWHPTADLIAVAMNDRAQVQFYRVGRDDAGEVIDLEPFGNRIVTAKWPMSGKFSPDGRFFVTNDLQWGPDVRGFYVNAPPSQLTVIEVAALEAEEPRHFVVGGVALPRHAESLAFSNDGTLIATSNIGQTWIEPGAPGASRSSLSLVAFDPASGQPTHVADYPLPDAVLPEGIAFDATDSHVVFGVYEYEGADQLDGEDVRGGLEVWRVVRDGGEPALEPTGHTITTPPGAHSLVLVAE